MAASIPERVYALERAIRLIWRALSNVVSKEAANRLSVVWQNSYEALEVRVTELEALATRLEEFYNDLL